MDLDLDCDVDVSVTCFFAYRAHSSYSTTLRLFSLHRSKVSLFRLSSGIILLAHWSLPLLTPLLPSFFSSRRCTHYAMPLIWSHADWRPGQSRRRAILWLSSLLLRLSEHCDHPVIDEVAMRRTHSSETDKSMAPPKSSHTSSSHRQEGTGFPLDRYSV